MFSKKYLRIIIYLLGGSPNNQKTMGNMIRSSYEYMVYDSISHCSNLSFCVGDCSLFFFSLVVI